MFSSSRMESDVQTTPVWVRDLEKKRLRPHKLAHEVGAGAACLTCGDACPGLDLHFWRKTCRNCKCGKEKHDVPDEDQGYHQFELLLGAGHKKTLQKTYQLNVGDAKTADGGKTEIAVNFDWVPPGITPDVAELYMLQIPESQRPISGSEGAQRRKEQLERQVPLHDVDPSHCHSLSEAEISGFESYRQHLREGAVGQGRVATLAAMLKELGLPYAIASREAIGATSHGISTQEAIGAPSYGISTQEAFSAHTRKLDPLKVSNNNLDESFPPPPSPETLSHFDEGGFPSPPPPLPNSMPPSFMQRPSAFLPKPFQKPAVTLHDANSNVQDTNSNFSADPQQELFDKKKQDMERLQQDIQAGSRGFVERSQLGLSFPQPLPMIEEVKSPGYETDPVSNKTIRAARFDNNNAAGELPGELAGLQLTAPEGSNAVCRHCSLPAAPGDVVVTADRAGPGAFWHPACFVCSTCKELLVDLIYFHKDDKLFCGRHFAEEVNIPRCAACDELIFTTEYTLAEERYFHVRHFCCIECDIPLAGMKYISREGQPCCLDCYQRKFSKTCNACRKLIGPSESSVIWQELHWHADAQCFRCVSCGKSLLNSKFAVREQQSLCSKECIQQFLKQKVTAL
ncbi:hypothetical protein B566_EDAN005563 [Ephemera danica]|nr:hypothetical protein B566_EDAN005563 [Ephemera danica]